jgi:transcriptional regulator with XRE-family HTH domain
VNYNKLDKLRKIQKMSIEELANKIDVSENGLSIALRNKNLKLTTLEKISEVLGVSPAIFFTNNEKENPNPNDPDFFYNKSGVQTIGSGNNVTMPDILRLQQQVEELTKDKNHLLEILQVKDELIQALKK